MGEDTKGTTTAKGTAKQDDVKSPPPQSRPTDDAKAKADDAKAKAKAESTKSDAKPPPTPAAPAATTATTTTPAKTDAATKPAPATTATKPPPVTKTTKPAPETNTTKPALTSRDVDKDKEEAKEEAPPPKPAPSKEAPQKPKPTTVKKVMPRKPREAMNLDKVYVAVKDVEKKQENTASMRNTVVALSLFAVALALVNIGTSYYAVWLSKETEISSGDLVDKDTDERVGVTAVSDVKDGATPIASSDYGYLRRGLSDTQTTSTEIEFGTIVSIVQDLCQDYTTDKSWEGVCGSTKKETVLNHCDHLTTVKMTVLPKNPNYSDEMYQYQLVASRGDYRYGTVKVFCPHGAEDKTLCTMEGFRCDTYCSLCGSDWFCDDMSDYPACGCTENTCVAADHEQTCTEVCKGLETIPDHALCCEHGDCCPSSAPTITPTLAPTPVRPPSPPAASSCTSLVEAYAWCSDYATCFANMADIDWKQSGWSHNIQQTEPVICEIQRLGYNCFPESADELGTVTVDLVNDRYDFLLDPASYSVQEVRVSIVPYVEGGAMVPLDGDGDPTADPDFFTDGEYNFFAEEMGGTNFTWANATGQTIADPSTVNFMMYLSVCDEAANTNN